VEEWTDSLEAGLIRWIVILPLASAALHGMLLGIVRARLSERSIWAISFSALVSAFALSGLALFELVGSREGQPILDSIGPWIGGGVGPRRFSAELTFQLDPLSGVFCLTLTSIAIAVYLFTIGAMHGGLMRSGLVRDEGVHRTFALLDLLIGSTLLLILADNVLLFFLGWVGVGVAGQLLASFALESRDSARAGGTTFVIARIGDLGLLGAALLCFDGLARSNAPALGFSGIRAAFRLLEGQGVALIEREGIPSPLLLELVGLGLVLAALTKCAQLPLHVWLPGAARGPVPAVALMQSVTSVVAGVYLLLRFSFLLELAPQALSVLVVLGAATMLLASLAAATQLDLFRLLAYATSSQLGLVLIGIGLGAWSTATFLLLTHAFVKAHLVLALGLVVLTLGGERDLRRMGGLAYRMRWTQGMVALAGLSLVGVPPLASFFPIEETLAFIVLAERPVLLAVVLLAVAVLAFALGRAYFLIFWGNVRPGGLIESKLLDPTGWAQHSLTGMAVMTAFAGLLTPSQFWGDLWGIEEVDSVGRFLVGTISGVADPGLEAPARGRWVAVLVASVALGLGLSAWRHARRGYRGEPRQPALRLALGGMRELLFFEQLYWRLLVRPLRALSSWVLVGGVEQRLIDRVVVRGGSDLMRRVVWSGLRRLQNGRLQSYMLLGLLTGVVIVTWMVG